MYEAEDEQWRHLAAKAEAPPQPRCDHCYAETLSRAWRRAKWGPGEARLRNSASYWRQPSNVEN